MIRAFNPRLGCSFLSSVASSSASAPEFNRTEKDGSAHVTSVNIRTNERSIVELRENSNVRRRRFRREFVLPEQAVAGLRQTIVDCGRHPKQLQHEADQWNEKLANRRFPAPPSVVKATRDELKRKIREEMEAKGRSFDGIIDDEKIKEAREYELRNKVDKLLKKSNFNWKPTDITSREAAAAYTLARLAPSYAEIARCLEEFKDFIPSTVLDYGSGTGAGFWAAYEKWGDSLKDYCLVDLSDEMIKFSMDVMRGPDGELLSRAASFRRHMLPSLQTTYDLVICHRSLGEVGSLESRLQLVEALWRRTNRYLIFIESGAWDSFEAVLDARDFILTSGITVNIAETQKLLEENNLLTVELEGILNDRELTDFERYHILHEKIPAEFTIPTNLPPATVFSPCPHDLGCPLQQSKTSCTFPVRWRSIRSDGRRGPREKDGTEIGQFSYVILEKGSRPPHESISRILKMRQHSGHVTCDVCTSFKGVQRFTLSKRAHNLYKITKNKAAGELLPLQMTTRSTENLFDVFDSVSKKPSQL